MLVSRPDSAVRLRAVLIGGFLLALCVAGLVAGMWKALILLPVPLGVLTTLRRKVAVDSTTLVAQGRFVRRSVQLNDLTQIAMSPFGRLWVGTADTSFMVSMVSSVREGDVPGVQEFPAELKARAEAAGAQVGPMPNGVVPMPEGTPWLFSR